MLPRRAQKISHGGCRSGEEAMDEIGLCRARNAHRAEQRTRHRRVVLLSLTQPTCVRARGGLETARFRKGEGTDRVPTFLATSISPSHCDGKRCDRPVRIVCYRDRRSLKVQYAKGISRKAVPLMGGRRLLGP